MTSGTAPRYPCSVCGRRQKQVDTLIAGTGGAHICDECVEMAY
jgi:ATP-dependent Clp protease ATP-binding subunit ClpX